MDRFFHKTAALLVSIVAISAMWLAVAVTPVSAQEAKRAPASGLGQAASSRVEGAAASTNELFCRAAKSGNIDIASLTLQQGADANFRCIEHPDDFRNHEKLPVIATAKGLLPLIFSRSSNGSLEAVDLLIKYGADINYQGRRGRRLVHDAIDLVVRDTRGNTGGTGYYNMIPVNDRALGNSLIERLVKHGADFNFLNSAGESLVWYTYRMGCNDKEYCERQEKLVDLLLSKGNSLDTVNAKGETLLFVAAGGCGIGLTKTLLGRGIDRGVRNKEGQTALDKALNTATSTDSKSDLGKRCNEVVALLMGTASVNSQTVESVGNNGEVIPGQAVVGPARNTESIPVGNFRGYITSTLIDGKRIQGKFTLDGLGTFKYQGDNGVQLIGQMQLGDPSNLTGTGTSKLPTFFGLSLFRYPDGSDSAKFKLAGKYENQAFQGTFASPFDNGAFFFTADKE